jgi:hypothetical protein
MHCSAALQLVRDSPRRDLGAAEVAAAAFPSITPGVLRTHRRQHLTNNTKPNQELS